MMNFKIENNYMDITNYPTMAKHFEEMAQKGWMIEKIRLKHIFIYKKIQPQSLDFSVSLYEIETQFSRKTQAEQQEFQEVCEMVGWQFVARNTDFYIYYKPKEVEAVPLQNDPEQELMELERIGKRMIGSYMIIGILFLFFSWISLSQFFDSVDGLLDGNVLWTGFFSPLIAIYFLMKGIQIQYFIKKNKHNIELGRELTYSKGIYIWNKMAVIINYVIYIFFFGEVFLVEKNATNSKFVLGLAFLPLVFGAIIGLFHSRVIKTSKMSLKAKKKGRDITLTVSIIGTIVIILLMDSFSSDTKFTVSAVEGYPIISVLDYYPDTNLKLETFRKNFSFLYPISYQYSTANDYVKKFARFATIDFQYTKASSEGLAKYLVERRKKQIINGIHSNREKINALLLENVYNKRILEQGAGISLKEFQQLRDLDGEEAIIKIIEKTISKQIREELEDIYGVDQCVIINNKNTGIILRKGKEVYYIIGSVDFTEPEVIEITKKKLGL